MGEVAKDQLAVVAEQRWIGGGCLTNSSALAGRAVRANASWFRSLRANWGTLVRHLFNARFNAEPFGGPIWRAGPISIRPQRIPDMKPEQKCSPRKTGFNMGLAVAMGAGIGAAMGNVAVGVAIGAAVGAAMIAFAKRDAAACPK